MSNSTYDPTVYSEDSAPEFLYAPTPGADLDHGPAPTPDDMSGVIDRAGRVLAVVFAELALVGGTVLSLAPGLPVSGYVAAIAFACYVGCRLVARVRARATT